MKIAETKKEDFLEVVMDVQDVKDPIFGELCSLKNALNKKRSLTVLKLYVKRIKRKQNKNNNI